MEKINLILQWIFALLCIAILPVFGLSVVTVIMFLLGVFSLVLSFTTNVMKKEALKLGILHTIFGLILVSCVIISLMSANRKYVLNNNTMKFHTTDCYAVDTIEKENKDSFKGERDDLLEDGYLPCEKCNP